MSSVLTMVNCLIYGYIAFRYDSDPEKCLASPYSDYRVTGDSKDVVDIGAMWRGLFTALFYIFFAQLICIMLLGL